MALDFHPWVFLGNWDRRRFPYVLHQLCAFDSPVSESNGYGYLRPVGRVLGPQEVSEDLDRDGQTVPDTLSMHGAHHHGWEFVDGYSGQHGYRGPVMHTSEFLGGAIADALLSTPGYYATVVVTGREPDDIDPAVAHPNGHPAIGWVLVHKPVPGIGRDR